ncbi:MAG: hypothetical protein AAFY03_02000 [Pseudomonadota bacterium]
MGLAAPAVLVLGACSGPSTPEVGRAGEADLRDALLGLGAAVDPVEAGRAAEVAYALMPQLVAAYQITDPPLIHNTKVNMGIKPRGLCWHWAEDTERRLREENFATLDVHRAIANHDNARIDHSTAIVSARGAQMFDGVVLDGWRHGGRLFWSLVQEDKRYDWRPQAEVLAIYAEREKRRR